MANKPKNKKTTPKKEQDTKKRSTTKPIEKTVEKNKVNQLEDRSKSGIIAVILFGISLLVLVLCCVPGGAADSIWEKIRTFTFGLFGLGAFLWPIWMIYIALMTGRNKINEKGVKWQIVGSAIFIIALSSLVHIIGNSKGYLVYTPIAEQLKTVFSLGLKLKNGGLFGTLIGGLLAMLCANKVAPICIILVIGLTVGLLVTKTSLDRLKDAISKPVKSANDKIKQKKVEKQNSYEEYDDASYADFTPDDSYDAEPYIPIEADEDYYIPENNKKVRNDFLSDKEPENKQPVKDIDLIMPEIITQSYADRKKAAESKPKKEDNLIHAFNIDESRSFSDKLDDLPSVKKDEYFSDNKPVEEPVEKPISTVVKPVRKTRKPKEEVKPEITNTEISPKDTFMSSETSYMTTKSGRSIIYKFPPNTCLSEASVDNKNYNVELQANGTKLVETLRSFGVETKIIDICRGPSVTRYEIQPAPGVKISRITGLADDIAMNMASSGVRIAPIPAKAAIGIEIPNKNRSMVSFREIIDSNVYKNSKSKLNVALGKDISGDIICADIAKMPHLLIAGTTGSGKSVCVNSMIVSLLYNATPDEVKFLMIDPKQVEFTIYDGIPHLLVPVVSDPKKAAGALAWAVTEMENRYKLLSERNVRNISAYNKLCDANTEIPRMYSIVIFIDEFSDLMMIAANEVEDSVCRLAQKARAAGIHLVIATQRPSVDVITGLIKANVPSRISLSVSSQIDSRTIIDTAGAEKLLGNGDMLFNPMGSSKPTRVQGAFLSDEEVENVVSFIKNQSKGDNVYDEDVQEKIDNFALAEKKKSGFDSSNDDEEDVDPMLARAIEVVVDNQMASTTLLQKKLKLGYARASRMIDSLEERGIVGPFQGSKPREVLMSKQQYLEMMALSEDGNLDMRSSSDFEEDNNDFDEEDDF